MNEGEKRLAVQTENHPISYAGFEGTIPEGEYGAGTVEIWDKGTYDPVEMTAEKKIVDIHGRKLAGRYALIKLKPRGKGKDVNWLFFKTDRHGMQNGRSANIRGPVFLTRVRNSGINSDCVRSKPKE